MTIDLYLVRHGETASNLRRSFGEDEDELTEQGVRQVQDLAQCLEKFRPDRFLSSPLRRAAQTAAILGEAMGLVPTLEGSVREARVGIFGGLTWEEASRQHPDIAAEVARSGGWSPVPGAESFEDLCRRALGWLESLGEECAHEERVLVVTHGGFLNALLWDLFEEAKFFPFRNAGLSRIRWGGRTIESVFIDHLPEELFVRVPTGGLATCEANEKGPAEAEPFP